LLKKQEKKLTVYPPHRASQEEIQKIVISDHFKVPITSGTVQINFENLKPSAEP